MSGAWQAAGTTLRITLTSLLIVWPLLKMQAALTCQGPFPPFSSTSPVPTRIPDREEVAPNISWLVEMKKDR